MSWTLTKTARFEASHRLPAHDGKCQRLHGHSWQVRVEVYGVALRDAGPKAGMVSDFADIGGPLKSLIDARLDHYHLNDTTPLPNPTSEALAQWIFGELAPLVPGLSAVTVEETCTSAARYQP